MKQRRISVRPNGPWDPTLAFKMELPIDVLQIISAKLLESSGKPSSGLLNIMSACGVCKQWRRALSQLPDNCHIAFDSQENWPARFRVQTPAGKRAFAECAARLLTNFSNVSLSGDSVTDQLLLSIARQGCLRSVEVEVSAQLGTFVLSGRCSIHLSEIWVLA